MQEYRGYMPKAITIEWETPWSLFYKLDAEFHFTIDVCATQQNAKCLEFYTKEDDGLKQEWKGVCWMNPPYGRELPKWIEKAYKECKFSNVTTVCLIPVRSDTKWWHQYVMKAHEVRLIEGRVKFGGKDAAPFPSCLVVFHGTEPRPTVPIFSAMKVPK